MKNNTGAHGATARRKVNPFFLKAAVCAAALVLVLTAGCSGSKTPQTLSGRYISMYNASNYLEFLTDGGVVLNEYGYVDQGSYILDGNVAVCNFSEDVRIYIVTGNYVLDTESVLIGQLPADNTFNATVRREEDLLKYRYDFTAAGEITKGILSLSSDTWNNKSGTYSRSGNVITLNIMNQTFTQRFYVYNNQAFENGYEKQ